MDTVGVITLTRHRPDLLKRAIFSVQNQKTSNAVEHLILVDECEETKHMLGTFKNLPRNVSWHWISRSSEEEHWVSNRCGKLRNHGVKILSTKWITFLDDDNEWAEDHIDSLVACAKVSGSPAVHSHRFLFYRNGMPFLEERYPWARDYKQGQDMYKKLSAKGVYVAGSCIQRDRVDPISNLDPVMMIDPSEDPVMMIDPGEWLLSRELLLEVPFKEQFSEFDRQNVLGEDAHLLFNLLERKVPIVCTNKATLLYYLGGSSTS